MLSRNTHDFDHGYRNGSFLMVRIINLYFITDLFNFIISIFSGSNDIFQGENVTLKDCYFGKRKIYN